jgi:adenylate cyclase class 2
MKKEIEVRIKIGSVRKIKNEIAKLGVKWLRPKIQVDSYFRYKDQVDAAQRPGSFILRIRRDGKSTFTMKALTDRRGVWEEQETVVEDADALEKILTKAGFVNVLTLHKKRTSLKYKEFSLEIDEIKELGDYLEAEIIGTDGEKLQEKIKKFFVDLGLNEKDIERRGYPEIIFEARGQKFEGQK